MDVKPYVTAICLLCACGQSAAQALGTEPVAVELPGIRFSLAHNGAHDLYTLDGNTLVLRSPAKRDNFRDPEGTPPTLTAPALLSEIDNSRPFTLTAKVTPTLDATYDAAALYVWVRDDAWLKMAVERDERHHTRLVTVRTEGTSDDNNHDVVTTGTVYMKISSNTRTVGFYYSVDNTEWQLVRLYRNAYPQKLWLGVGSQSPMGEGNTSTFEDITLTQTAVSDFRMGR